jgi:hypothetical protein
LQQGKSYTVSRPCNYQLVRAKNGYFPLFVQQPWPAGFTAAKRSLIIVFSRQVYVGVILPRQEVQAQKG